MTPGRSGNPFIPQSETTRPKPAGVGRRAQVIPVTVALDHKHKDAILQDPEAVSVIDEPGRGYPRVPNAGMARVTVGCSGQQYACRRRPAPSRHLQVYQDWVISQKGREPSTPGWVYQSAADVPATRQRSWLMMPYSTTTSVVVGPKESTGSGQVQ